MRTDQAYLLAVGLAAVAIVMLGAAEIIAAKLEPVNAAIMAAVKEVTAALL